MNELDKKILDQLQNDFPIAADPYSIIAQRLGVDGDEIFERVKALVCDGTIRRVGLSMDSRKLGCASTLAAIKVGENRIETACEIIDSLAEVTHSYQRTDEFNIWFTIIAPDKNRLQAVFDKIKTELGLADGDVLNLPVKRMFKLDARFNAQR